MLKNASMKVFIIFSPFLHRFADTHSHDDILEPPQVYNSHTSNKRIKTVLEGNRRVPPSVISQQPLVVDDITNSQSTTASQLPVRQKGRPKGSSTKCSACGTEGHRAGSTKCPITSDTIREGREAQKKGKKRQNVVEGTGSGPKRVRKGDSSTENKENAVPNCDAGKVNKPHPCCVFVWLSVCAHHTSTASYGTFCSRRGREGTKTAADGAKGDICRYGKLSPP
jgi:hypothetical protein